MHFEHRPFSNQRKLVAVALWPQWNAVRRNDVLLAARFTVSLRVPDESRSARKLERGAASLCPLPDLYFGDYVGRSKQ